MKIFSHQFGKFSLKPARLVWEEKAPSGRDLDKAMPDMEQNIQIGQAMEKIAGAADATPETPTEEAVDKAKDAVKAGSDALDTVAAATEEATPADGATETKADEEPKTVEEVSKKKDFVTVLGEMIEKLKLLFDKWADSIGTPTEAKETPASKTSPFGGTNGYTVEEAFSSASPLIKLKPNDASHTDVHALYEGKVIAADTAGKTITVAIGETGEKVVYTNVAVTRTAGDTVKAGDSLGALQDGTLGVQLVTDKNEARDPAKYLSFITAKKTT